MSIQNTEKQTKGDEKETDNKNKGETWLIEDEYVEKCESSYMWTCIFEMSYRKNI